MSNYDYLDLATIWKSKAKGTLSLVIALANFDLPKKYAKTNPPMVIFTDGMRIFSSPVDRFLDLRYFVRKDEVAYDHLMQIFSAPITEDDDQPLLQDEDEEDDLMLADSDDSDETVAERMNPVEASALTKEESKLYETSSGKIIEANALMPARIVITATENSEALDSAANSFYMYDQMRTLDGVFYHKLTFSELSAVYTILNNVQSIESLSVQYKDVIIPIEPDYIVSTYTSVENMYNDAHKLTDVRYAYNIIVAQAVEEDEEELSLKDESDEPTSVEFTTTANATESFAPIADSASDDTVAVGTRVDSENPVDVNGATVQESTGELVDESDEDASIIEDGVEEISINSDLQESSEEDDVEDILEEPKEQEPELENAEELLEDHKLLVESLVMPEDDAEDAPIDDISESLAEKLETVLALEKDNYNSNNASNEEQASVEKPEEAEETKESESEKPLNEAAFDGLSASEEKKED